MKKKSDAGCRMQDAGRGILFFVVFTCILYHVSCIYLYCEGTPAVVKAITDESSNEDLSALNEINKRKNKLVHIAIEAVEIKNESARTLGIKWVDTIQVGEVAHIDDSRVPRILTDVPALFRVGEFARWTSLSADIKLLVSKGAARLLAKPKIIAKSETNAFFTVGGEVPYPVVTRDEVNVEWKEYGTRVNLLPTVLDNNQVGLSIFTDVSDLDYAHGVVISGFSLPALITRKASSSVILRDGETLALAGLERNFKEETTSGVPFLSDIPILGQLFSHKTFTDIKTTVVIFITPTIVKEGAPIEKTPY
ncbi:MAG: type II and III secretion system protein [Elusimicrobiota bacterium]